MMTKPFALDKKNKKVLNERVIEELAKKKSTMGFMREMVSSSMRKEGLVTVDDSQLFPSDGGRAGLVFKELLKLNKVDHLPGYAYFAYDQSFLHFLPDFQLDVIEKPLDN